MPFSNSVQFYSVMQWTLSEVTHGAERFALNYGVVGQLALEQLPFIQKNSSCRVMGLEWVLMWRPSVSTRKWSGRGSERMLRANLRKSNGWAVTEHELKVSLLNSYYFSGVYKWSKWNRIKLKINFEVKFYLKVLWILIFKTKDKKTFVVWKFCKRHWRKNSLEYLDACSCFSKIKYLKCPLK